jgi:hypothetical protein
MHELITLIHDSSGLAFSSIICRVCMLVHAGDSGGMAAANRRREAQRRASAATMAHRAFADEKPRGHGRRHRAVLCERGFDLYPAFGAPCALSANPVQIFLARVVIRI